MFQVSLYGLAGILVAAEEGFEMNLMAGVGRLARNAFVLACGAAD